MNATGRSSPAPHDPVGRIFDIQRFCIHDGPGIRTTVFLKGCPMRCLWCHNPEGMERPVQLSFLPDKCIGCGYCQRACSRGAHVSNGDGRHVLDRSLCVVCGTCAGQCPADALELIGRDATAADALAVVLRDEPFYRTSGGGMTLSGGEPLAQIEFSEDLLRRAKAVGLHTAVETCGWADWERFERLIPLTDLWLYDLKETNADGHLEYTGVELGPVLDNLRALTGACPAVLLRLPIVPGLNDRADHFAAVARLAGELPPLYGVEVLPYHRLGLSKRERLGMAPSTLGDVQTPSDQQVRQWAETLGRLGAPMVNDSDQTNHPIER